MEIWIRSGPDFHAGRELEQWLRKRIDSDHSSAVIACVHELLDVRLSGFAGRGYLWQREGFADVWTFRTLRFRLAATIPGDGRGDTHDFCLVASERIEIEAKSESKRAFLDCVRSRLANGSQMLWTI